MLVVKKDSNNGCLHCRVERVRNILKSSPTRTPSIVHIKMVARRSVFTAARRSQQLARKPSFHLGTKPMLRQICLSSWRRAPELENPPSFHKVSSRNARPASEQSIEDDALPSPDFSNPALSFPCLDAQEARTASLSNRSLSSGPEPSYTSGVHSNWHSQDALLLDWGGILPEFDIAFENWGSLNDQKSNAILLHTGLSASSHAHSTEANPKSGWWEKFIGSGAPLDTDKYYIICTNIVGGCYGSTGPSSLDPANGLKYATRFPIVTIEDMVRAQFMLLDSLGIKKLHASVGSSMGGMQTLAAGVLFPERVGKLVSVSGCARSHPYSIAMRHTQRQVLMMDPNWLRGFYYNSIPPHAGMKLAREIATVTYRSGPEWEQRFGRRRADPSRPPALCPDFLIETYLDHAGEKFCLEYDANSLLYVSKAMDLFDLGREHQMRMNEIRRLNNSRYLSGNMVEGQSPSCSLALPDQPYEEKIHESASRSLAEPAVSTSAKPPDDLVAGLKVLRDHPTLIMGVASDILFPAWQQREIAETLRAAGNRSITHVELGEDTSLYGHDTFLLNLEHIGGNIRSFLG